MNAQTKQKGFTIIEVVLVLAIAGLIFLMVFIALPALQRNQRDTTRKSDVSRVQTAINNAQANDRGRLPTLDSTFITKYLKIGDDSFEDPSGKGYVFSTRDEADSPTNKDMTDSGRDTVRIYTTNNATCDVDGKVKLGAGARKIAVRLVLEGGGVHCLNN
jgi:prepilin-type N-terminal cleavage/methylation domain-containing protein